MSEDVLSDLIAERDLSREYPALGCLRSIIQRRADRKGPAFITIGRRIFYRRAAINRWLLDQEIQPKRPRAA